MAQEVTRTYVYFDDGLQYLIDTIEHQGELWLVPGWLASPYPGMQKPVRMIRLPKDRLQDLGHDFLGTGVRARRLDGQVPKAVADGTSQSDWPPGVVEAPELLIRR